MAIVRRFIAGAVCPDCGAMDKLVMLVGSADQGRECVNCNYSDSLADTPEPEPETRVNQVRPGETALAHEPEVQILQLQGAKPNKD